MSISQIPIPAKGLLHRLDNKGLLYFSVNPAQITRQMQPEYSSTGSPGAAGPYVQYVGGGQRSISFELIFDSIGNGSEDVIDEMNTLESYTLPATKQMNSRKFVAPPRALLCIGTRKWEGYVSQIQFTEEMFNAMYRPIFAKAQVTFVIDNWRYER